MPINRGKQFEERFKTDWRKTFPHSFLYRLPDQQSMYFGTSKNLCDFIAFNNNRLYLIECKSHAGASIPIQNITQFEKLSEYIGYEGIVAGVVLWLYDKDKVFFIPISTIHKAIKDGKKSIGLSAIKEGYIMYDVPSIKKRVFMESDYSFMSKL